jgi:hypothetical protein
MLERYARRRESEGWTVFDVWTGRPVVIADLSQSGLPEREAVELATMLNEHARRGNRVVLQ